MMVNDSSCSCKCLVHRPHGLRYVRGTQRPNVSKYARSVSNAFLLALEACLVILELPQNLFICSDRCLRGTLVVTNVLGGFFVSSESVIYALTDPVESLRT